MKLISGGGGSASLFSSGGVTVNVLAKADGAGALKDSAVTDNGTNVASTLPVVVPDASSGAILSIQRSGAANSGMYMTSTSTGLVNQTNGWLTISNTAAAGIQVPLAGGYGISSSATIAAIGSDVFLGRVGAANWQFGKAAGAAPVSYTINIGESSRGGTDSNVAGGNGTIRPGIGTGTGLASKLALQRNLVGTTGTVAQTQSDAFAIGQSKTLSNTSATAQTVATITLGSNAGGGCAGTFTLVATDGTNFDSETQFFTVSYVNKATVVTVGTPAITASTAANNSGSATLGITAVANGNNIDIKVTPVFTTIVPTTVTLYPTISHATGTVTFV